MAWGCELGCMVQGRFSVLKAAYGLGLQGNSQGLREKYGFTRKESSMSSLPEREFTL